MSCPIQRALISVHDKTGVVAFARTLTDEFGIEVLSTGGTAALLRARGVPVTQVEDVTGSGEMLDGRVKTLHPRIHAAILADRDNPDHMRQLAEAGIQPIDMVVVSLYPFEETVRQPDCTFAQAIEMIDIGGPCMLRAAAKNHAHVLVCHEPKHYGDVLRLLRRGDPAEMKAVCRQYARAAFFATSVYDGRVFEWLAGRDTKGYAGERLLHLTRGRQLRYGENPHQSALAYELTGGPMGGLMNGARAHGNPDLSFNNYVDASAAVSLSAELSESLGAKQCGTGFQPVQSEAHRATGPRPSRPPEIAGLPDERHTRRNLPDFQTPGKTYFVTFRVKGRELLTDGERGIVLDACRFWDGRKFQLHACVVMPDHVHILLTPQEIAPNVCATLGDILHSIKRFSAREINKLRGRSGPVWLDESFDRIMRNEREFRETADYIGNNPIKAGLVESGEYRWWWDEEVHRLQTGATPEFAHRLETGATQGLSAARNAVCVFIKHTNACGVGVDVDPVTAYRRAYLGDPIAAMGGILAVNFPVDREFARAVMETYQRWGKDKGAGGFFVEVWVAPTFADDGVVQYIRSAKEWGSRARLIPFGDAMEPANSDDVQLKQVAGGMLVQDADCVGLNEDQWTVVTRRRPTDAEMNDLRLAWLVCKHTKSNAVTICKDNMLIGNGAGQMSRVMSCRIATWLAQENGHADALTESVAASDAFFPFRDGPDLLMQAGVRAIIQPGGSKRDEETIAACDAREAAMIFTGTRHFRH